MDELIINATYNHTNRHDNNNIRYILIGLFGLFGLCFIFIIQIIISDNRFNAIELKKKSNFNKIIIKNIITYIFNEKTGFKFIPQKIAIDIEPTTDINCSICIEDFKNNDNIIRLSCNHNYHYDCILEWFKSNPLPNCPICRDDQIILYVNLTEI
jgi:hypothetical protein